MEIRTINHFVGYIGGKLKRDKYTVAIIIFSLVMHAVAALVTPIITMKLIDDILPQHNYNIFWWFILLLVMVPTIGGAMMTFEDYNANKLGHKVVTKYRVDFFSKYLKLKYRTLFKNDSGKMLQLIIEEPEEIAHWIYITGIQVILNLLVLLFMFFLLFYLNFYLGVLCLGCLLLYYIPFFFYRPHLKETSKKVMQKRMDSAGMLNEGLKAFYTAKVFGIKDYLISKYDKVNWDFLKKHLKYTLIQQQSIFTNGLIKIIGIGLVYLYGGWKVIKGDMTLGLMLAAKMYIDQIFLCGGNLFERVNQTYAKILIANRLKMSESHDYEVEIDGQRALTSVSEIQFSNVNFAYEEKDILDNINLNFTKKDHVAIVGASGCGKSTLLKLLIRLYDLKQGTILLNRLPIQEYDLSQLRERVNLVNQNQQLLDGTIWENLTFGIAGIDKDRVIKVAKDLNIDSFVSEMPDKYETRVGLNSDRSLSGGQIQRIAIARALIQCPDVLLLDEVTSALDKNNTIDILKAIQKSMQEKIVIHVTHNLFVAESVQDIIYFDPDQGMIRDTHENLMQVNKNYRQHFNRA